MEDTTTTTPTNAPQVRQLGFDFRGDGTEYFKIWIVNILLTIVTLGIYSAWAKVRNNRYFYSNLFLDGSNFRYLADPMAIFKGRVIAIIALIIYTVVFSVFPPLGIALGIALFFAIPYFVNKSLAFNHRMSAYKNIQFRFSASYGESFMVQYIWPLLGILTLGLLMPLALQKMHEYLVKNSSYGTSAFDYTATTKDYFIIFLTVVGIGLMAGLPAWGIAAMSPDLGVFVAPVLFTLMYVGIIVFTMTSLINLFYSNVVLQEHGFEAKVTMPELALVLLANAFFTVITLGLYMPAAKVRMVRYISSRIVMDAQGSLDDFSAAEKENVSALGEEFGEVFDFGL
jgi:uncharacterized membrane protein YjgN (DUF898 family)